MIKIQQLLPLLRKGWVAMDESEEWYWFEAEPKSNEILKGWNSFESVENLFAFDIEPVADWKESLMECGNEF